MKVRNLAIKFTFCLMIILGVQFTANAQITAFATVGPSTPAPNINFTGMCNGTFTLATNDAYAISKLGLGATPNATMAITPLVGNCANYLFNPATGIWHLPLADADGGFTQFTVRNSATGNFLLQGRFKRAILHGRSGSSSLALTLWEDNVDYNPNHSPLLGGLQPNNGSLSIAILSKLPVLANMNGPLPFWANGDINFGATD